MGYEKCETCDNDATHSGICLCVECSKVITEPWLIWSNEHKAWWKPHVNGYTPFRSEAGTYSYKEALQIVAQANIACGDIPNETIVPVLGQ